MEITRPEPSFDISDVSRLIVVRNPVSSNARKSQAQVDDISANTGLHIIEIESDQDSKLTIEKLAGQAEDGDIIHVLGGDGLANTVLQFAGLKTAPDVAVMFSESGSTNNGLACTTNPSEKLSPSERLMKGRLANVIPLRGTIIRSSENQRLAWNIISVGAIATGASVLNQPKHRNSHWWKNEHTRFAYKVGLSLTSGIMQTRTLRITDGLHAKPFPMYDRFITRGPTIADVAKFDSEMTDSSFVYGEIRDQLPWHLWPSLIRLMRGTLAVREMSSDAGSIAFHVPYSTHNKRALAQFDGDTVPITGDSLIRLDQPRADDPKHRAVPVVTTRQRTA